MKTLGDWNESPVDCLTYFLRVFGTTVILSHLTGHVIGLWSERKKEEAELGCPTR